MILPAITPNASYEFAEDVRAGLSRSGQKELPSKYFYDGVGSALFEVISHLPEYGLTRADERVLRRYAHEIVHRLPLPVAVAELGSGSGKKTRGCWRRSRGASARPYYPVEISRAALEMCRASWAISIRSASSALRTSISRAWRKQRRTANRGQHSSSYSWAARLEILTGPRAFDF